MANKKSKNNNKGKTNTKSKASNQKHGKSDNSSANKTFWTAMSMALGTVLLSIFCYSQATGIVGEMIHEKLLLGLFSAMAYAIPPVMLGLTIYIFRHKNLKRLGQKSLLAVSLIILVSSLCQLFTDTDLTFSELFSNGMLCRGGGLLGGSVALLFDKMIGKIASVVVILFACLVLVSLLFKISFVQIFKSICADIKEDLAEMGNSEFDDEDDVEDEQTEGTFEKLRKRFKKKKEHPEDDEDDKDDKTASKPSKDIDLNFPIDGLSDEPSGTKKDDPKISKKDLQDRINQLISENTETPAPPVTGGEDSLDDGQDDSDLTDSKPELKPLKHVQTTLDTDSDEAPAKQQPERVAPVTTEEKDKINNEINSAIEVPAKEYEFPPIKLLERGKTTSADKRKEMSETAMKLMETLKSFGVEAKLQQVTQGPTVTRYEIQPSTGVKLSKIQGLAEDIALNLAISTVLVAPVPGKAAVGIEVPNASVNTVSVRELLESQEYMNAKSKLTVAFGKDIGGNVVIGDIAKMPHVLIAGSTGSGKSVCINTIIVSILYKAKPDEVKLIMIDPKVVELSVYNGIPHLLIPVVTDPKRAAGALNWAVGEMMRRYALFAQTATRNLEGYNNLMLKKGEEKLPQILIIIDELADLMMVAAKEVEEYICRLAQLARAAGIHLVIATQRPSVDVITGLIKANVPSRIAFAVSSQIDSRTILDKGGAEKLLGRGDMLFQPAGSSPRRVQGAFVSDDEITNITDFVRSNNEDSHYSEDLAEHIDNCANGDYGVTDEKDDDDADELLPEAIELALELGQISTAMIQRRLKVGYARAGRIIDQMELRGLISGANGSKPREVYRNRILSTGDFDSLPTDEE